MNDPQTELTAAAPSRVRLVRHAESEGNAGLPTLDPTSIRLTTRGNEQARALAARFDTAPDLIVVSPYLRTQQTAAPLIRRYPEVPVEVRAVQEFTYLSPSRYQGTTEAQRCVPAQDYWQRCDPRWNDGDGAESFTDLIRRVDELLLWLNQQRQSDIVVFTHGRFIKALLLRREYPDAAVDSQFMAMFRDGWKSDQPSNASVVELIGAT